MSSPMKKNMRKYCKNQQQDRAPHCLHNLLNKLLEIFAKAIKIEKKNKRFTIRKCKSCVGTSSQSHAPRNKTQTQIYLQIQIQVEFSLTRLYLLFFSKLLSNEGTLSRLERESLPYIFTVLQRDLDEKQFLQCAPAYLRTAKLTCRQLWKKEPSKESQG